MRRSQAGQSAFKRQVVFRLDPEQWSFLERAAFEHGSIQAALVAGLHALADSKQHPIRRPRPDRAKPAADANLSTHEASSSKADEEVSAREAARILCLKPATVRGYIRSGRLPGRYEDTPGRMGWVTSQAAVTAYKQRVQTDR